MITAIREVRRAKGLTLGQVAARCVPPTTAQTIGRLETGTRTVSVDWLNRIAAALEVQAADLVTLPERIDVPVAAILAADGAHAPPRESVLTAPRPEAGSVGVTVTSSVGDYRAGDQLWCAMLSPDQFGAAINHDVLAPRPGGRFIFGRMIGRDGARLQILPPGPGGRQQVVAEAPWVARVTTLVRRIP